MRKTVLMSILFVFLFGIALQAEEIRTWTIGNGTYKGKLIEVTDDNVKIEDENGLTLSVPKAKLSEEDKAYLNAQQSETQTKVTPPPTKMTDAEYLVKWEEIRARGKVESAKYTAILVDYNADSQKAQEQKAKVDVISREALQLLEQWSAERKADRQVLIDEGIRTTNERIVSFDKVINSIEDSRCGFTSSNLPVMAKDMEALFQNVPTRKPGDVRIETYNGVSYRFRWCPAGTFMMGSPLYEENRNDNETQHEVTLTKGFWMLETEVTQEMWESVMGNNPSHYPTSGELPVENVSWYDCQSFCQKLSEKLGVKISLPTEAQWEYACRAGTTGAYAGNLSSMAWYGGTDGTHLVGRLQANAWGLYDMHGNVFEWCQDCWCSRYPVISVTDPTGPSSGSSRVFRGGSWFDLARYCRSASRSYISPVLRIGDLGLRVLLEE